MGFRFRRSFKLLPGVRINLSGRGTSVSLGGRGFHYNIGPKGTRVTAGIPGTGLSWTKYRPYARSEPDNKVALPSAPSDPPDARYQFGPLRVVQNAGATQINAFSTSQLAPILNAASRRIQLAPAVLILCLLLFVAAAMQTEQQRWMGLTALFATVFVPITIFLDRYRRSVKVTFDPEGLTGRISEALSVAFTELTKCMAVWIVEAEGRTTDWKRNAGATGLNKRKATSLRFGKPDCLRGKAVFPTFRVRSDQLYLLPDAALLVVRGEIASVSYAELELSSNVVRFIEEERLPPDTTVVDHTWRYVNKSGGPDRRFINNAQLPICLYGELMFRSAGGLNCKLHISAAQAADPLCRVIDALKRTLVEIPTSITYIKTASRWPTIVVLSFFMFLAFIQACFLQGDIRVKLANSRSNAIVNDVQPSRPPQMGRNDTEPPPKVVAKGPALQKPSLPIDSNQQSSQFNSPTNNTAPDTSVQAFDLSDPQNVLLIQSRLRELGFLRGPTKGWDSFSRSALRDFKATNNLALDDKWDLKTQELLASGPILRIEQTFVGSWSESTCDSSEPDLFINSRRAASSAGGVCEFSNIRRAGSVWSIATTCSNAGEKWKATVQLAVSEDKMVWTGRDGSRTQYQRCQ